MFMSFFHSVLEYPCPTILRDMCNATWHAILNIQWCCNLSSLVNEHQNDWDEHLPYISMAYRAAEHETTGNTPNYMMLGREVTTPLALHKHASLVVNPGLTFGKKTNT
jgi:hypothetical protein